MQLPALPVVPTDSLHKFLTITGCLILFVPPFYLYNKIDAIELEVIHVKTERKILDARGSALDYDLKLMNRKIYGTDISKLTPLQQIDYTDSLGRLHKLANTSFDSANVGLDKLLKTAVEQKITGIQLDEKDEIIKQNINSVKEYLELSKRLAATGILMLLPGLVLWFIRENTDIKFSVQPGKKTTEQE